MEVSLETVWRLLSIVAILVSLGSMAAVFMNSPGRKLEGSLKALSASFEENKEKVGATLREQQQETLDFLKGHDRRIQAVEDEIKHLPTSEEMAELQISVTRVEGDVKRIEGTLDRVDHVVQRIDDYLRANK